VISELIIRSQNNRVDAEKSAGARVLLAQHPRPSRFSGHDRRSARRETYQQKIKIPFITHFHNMLQPWHGNDYNDKSTPNTKR
jgi:hypothetical protein